MANIIHSAPHRLFLLVSLIFGTAYALLIPPFQSPDEPNHLLRAWQISEGRLLPERRPDQRLGGELPLCVQAAADSFFYLKNDYAARTGVERIRAMAAAPVDYTRRGFVDFANTALYLPFGYLPQATAIVLLRPTGCSVIGILFAARLFNLLIWSLLCFYALRLLPFKRQITAALLLLPASLVMAASCNADALTNGLSCWIIAACLRGRERSRRQNIALTAALALVSVQKLVLAPFALLLWFQNGKPDQNRWKMLVVALCIAAAGIGAAQARHWFIPYDAYNADYRVSQTLNEGVNPPAQIEQVLRHPFAFAGIVARSFGRALPSTTAHILGKFGWEKNYLPGWGLALLAAGLVLLLFSEKNPLTRGQRALAAASAALYLACFSVTMYALWMPLGAAELGNLQGRYFTPVLPLLALLCGPLLPGRLQKSAVPAAWFLVILAQGLMLCSIWARYMAMP